MTSTYQCKNCKYEFESEVSLITDQLKKGFVLRCPKCHSTHLKELIKYQKPRRLREIEEFDRPLTQDRENFLKAQPFVCDNCKKFTDILREYCENCGSKDSLRKATNDDFDQHIKIAEPIIEVSQLKAEEVQLLPPISEENERKGKYCVFCGAYIEEVRRYCHNCGKLVLKIKPEEKQVNQPLLRGAIEEKVLVEKELVAEEPIEEEDLVEVKLAVEEPIEEEEIEEIIENERKGKYCVFCGAYIEEVRTYCPNCGKLILKIKPEEKQVSQPLIRRTIEEDVLVEKELVAEEPIEEEDLVEVKLAVEEPIEETFFFCKFCGIKLEKEATFCSQCGTAVKNK